MNGDETNNAGGLEKSVSELLNRAYEPVECRAEFRDELLGKLKERQRVHKSERTIRRRKVVRFYGSTVALAAAAAVILSVLPWRAATVDSLGETPAANPDTDASVEVAGADGDETASSSETENWVRLARDDTPVIEYGTLAPEPQGVGAAKMVSYPSLPLRVMNPARLATDENAWQTLTADQGFSLKEDSCLMPPEDAEGEVGVWVGDGGLVALWPGGELTNTRGELRLVCGEAMAMVHEGSAPLVLQVPDYRLSVKPGSKIFIRVYAGDQWADGGAPAPCVTVLEGSVKAEGPHGMGDLRAGNAYRLYSNFVNGLPGHALTETRRRTLPTRTASGPRGALVSTGRDAAPTRSAVVSGESRERLDTGSTSRAAVVGVAEEDVVNGRTFRLEDGTWIQDGYAPDARVQSFEFGSDAYYKFLRENQWLKYYMYHLGRDLIVEHDGAYVHVHP